MTINIQQALRPLFITYCLIGLNIYPIKVSKSITGCIAYTSVLYSLTVWFVYGYVFYYVMNLYSQEDIVYAVVMYINIIISLTTMIISVCYNKKFWICLKKVAAVDDSLEKLGIPKIYKKINMWSKRVVIGWITHSLILNCYDILWWVNNTKTASLAFIMPHILNYCIHINAFVDLIFLSFIWYIGTRFDKVNEQMRHLLVNKEHELRCNWKKPAITVQRYTLDANNYKQVLWSSMHLHLELCRITREFNLLFGIQMTLEMAAYLLFLMAMCSVYYQVLLMQKYRLNVALWFNIAFWSFGFIARLFAINYMCENISAKASEIDKIIDQLRDNLRYVDVLKEIHQFTLQIIYHPLRLTGMGLFYFGNEFLRKFCMALVMFAIIILQMSRFS